MATHVIMAEDWRAGGEPRAIVWDDETGEISGEHHVVPRLRLAQERLEREGGWQDDMGYWRMPDPRLDPACVRVLIVSAVHGMLDLAALPEPLRSADWRALFVPARLEPGTVF